MFKKKNKDVVLEMLEDQINDCAQELKNLTADDESYVKTSKAMFALIAERDKIKSQKRLSPDTVALIVANLVGIGLILGYEHAHNLTSKAIGFVSKLKV